MINWLTTKFRQKKIEKMLMKHPLPLPDDNDPLPLCVLDAYVRDWIENNCCPAAKKYHEMLRFTINLTLKCRGYELVERPYQYQQMPTYLKQPNQPKNTSVQVPNWVGR